MLHVILFSALAYLNHSPTSLDSYWSAPAGLHSASPVPRQLIATAAYTNLWKPFTAEELGGIADFIKYNTTLNVTARPGSWDNYVAGISVLPPNKTGALEYIAGRSGTPPKYARVSVVFGASDPAYAEDYALGPVPITQQTQLLSLDWWANSGSTRTLHKQADSIAARNWAREALTVVEDFIKDIFSLLPAQIAITLVDPIDGPDGSSITWAKYSVSATTIYDSDTILPLGLYHQIDTNTRNTSKWRHRGWFYDGQHYHDTAALVAAYRAGTFTGSYVPRDGPWTSTRQSGQPFVIDQLPKPSYSAPHTERVAVDVDNMYAEWGCFSFYMSFSYDVGLSLHDLRCDNQTVAYELSMQEAVSHYAGQDPAQALTAFLDTRYGIGANTFPLVRGYDCSPSAVYLNTTVYSPRRVRPIVDAICLFEVLMPTPIQRHTTQRYVSVTQNIALHLRTIATVGNYDYIFTYIFQVDGSFEVMVEASGYILGAAPSRGNHYGYQIHPGLSSSMHDHQLVWKVDMDVCGLENTLAVHSVVPARITYPWANGTFFNTMQLIAKTVNSEDEASLNWPANGQSMFIVENRDTDNTYGQPQGYRIRPAANGAVHLAIQNSTLLQNAGHFCSHDLYATRHKDTESRASHPNNYMNRQHPIVDFGKFQNGESLVQTDLVLFVSLGMHHVPHTGDLPNTVTTSARSSVLFTPHNFHKADPSRRSAQQIFLNLTRTE